MVHFLLASAISAVSALTVSTQTEVAITRVSVPIVVFGAGAYDLQAGRVDGVDMHDATQEQLDAAKAQAQAAGIDPTRIRTWMQKTRRSSIHGEEHVQIGIVMIDLGTPNEANAMLPAVRKMHGRDLAFGSNEFVSVDCDAMQRQTLAGLESRARALADIYGATVRPGSLAMTTDPRVQTFAPVPLCPADQRPVVTWAGRLAPAHVPDRFTHYASANVGLAIAGTVSTATAPPGATSVFPYSTFGFAGPIIGQQDRGYVLGGGRFGATPGASEVAVRAQGALLAFRFNDATHYQSAAREFTLDGVAKDDLYGDDGATTLYVRVTPFTRERFAQLRSIVSDSPTVYRFLRDCAPLQRYARAVARDRSRRLAQAAAAAMHVRLGGLVVETDYAGPATDTTCGSDGSGDLAHVVALVEHDGRASSGDPLAANFWDSIYDAWALGAPPRIVSTSIVGRGATVLRANQSGEPVTGTLTVEPDAYFYTTQASGAFRTTVVASRSDVPKDESPGNVVTDCEAAQERALANAVRVALAFGPVGSFYAAPAQFASIACLPPDVVGHWYDSLPTTYNSSSPTGAAQVQDTITVYP